MATIAAISDAISLQRTQLAGLLERRPVCPDGDEGWWLRWEHEQPWFDDPWGIHGSCQAWLAELDEVARAVTLGPNGRRLAVAETLHHLNYLGEFGTTAPFPHTLLVRSPVEISGARPDFRDWRDYVLLLSRDDWTKYCLARLDGRSWPPRSNGHGGHVKRPARMLLVAQWVHAGLVPADVARRWAIRTGGHAEWLLDRELSWDDVVPASEEAAYEEWRAAGGQLEDDLDESQIGRWVRRVRADLAA